MFISKTAASCPNKINETWKLQELNACLIYVNTHLSNKCKSRIAYLLASC